jgi:predicted ABC-type ATPase
MKPKPLLIILAGPNGAGKSTFYRFYLSKHGLPFINADHIAVEVFGNQEPATAIPAAKIADELRQKMVTAGRSFIFETVLSDPVGAKIDFMKMAQTKGFIVDAHFIAIATPALSNARVMQRVATGGHDVPLDKIQSRFSRTFDNLTRLIPMADQLTIYDNSDPATPYRPIAFFQQGQLLGLATQIPSYLDSFAFPSLITPATSILP